MARFALIFRALRAEGQFHNGGKRHDPKVGSGIVVDGMVEIGRSSRMGTLGMGFGVRTAGWVQSFLGFLPFFQEEGCVSCAEGLFTFDLMIP